MIIITRNIDNPITNTLYLTLSEHQQSASQYYHFTFIHRVTQDEVDFFSENISTKPNYQKFEVLSSEFDDVNLGFYTYEVRAANNQGTQIVGDILETGFMNLKSSSEFAPIKYSEQSNNFKTYNG
jgi:hypothetical protein